MNQVIKKTIPPFKIHIYLFAISLLYLYKDNNVYVAQCCNFGF